MSRYDIASEFSAAQLAANYKSVLEQVREAAEGREVRLVTVSKTKSPACVQAVYDAGHRMFGENYVQELAEKVSVLPPDIAWRFIGHLQSNKVKELLTVAPNLAVIETVDSEKLASKINDGCEKYREGRSIEVYVQVNTSGEESKSGTEPGAATVALVRHIKDKCPLLVFKGLMTIGMLDYTSKPENFACLSQCREEVAKELQVPVETLELSMGMSNDFINAIKMGATSVRVGTSIFGTRYFPPKN